MPLHDWSTQDDEVFHDFHLTWSAHLKEALNSGLLPDDLFARCETNIRIEEPDDELSYDREPDVGIVEIAASREGGSLLLETESPPQTDLMVSPSEALQRTRTVAIRRRNGDLVAAIEFSSALNLKSAARRQRFADKCLAMAHGGVHICILNAHQLRGRVPSAEAIIAEELAFDYEERSDDTAAMTSFRVTSEGRGRRLYADRPRVGEELRTLPCFVDELSYVPLPLAETYDRTFNGLPKFVRAKLSESLT